MENKTITANTTSKDLKDAQISNHESLAVWTINLMACSGLAHYSFRRGYDYSFRHGYEFAAIFATSVGNYSFPSVVYSMHKITELDKIIEKPGSSF